MATERSEIPFRVGMYFLAIYVDNRIPLAMRRQGDQEGTDMWKVMQIVKNGIAFYVVENTETGERKRGEFDCERSAQSFADYLNKRKDG